MDTYCDLTPPGWSNNTSDHIPYSCTSRFQDGIWRRGLTDHCRPWAGGPCPSRGPQWQHYLGGGSSVSLLLLSPSWLTGTGTDTTGEQHGAQGVTITCLSHL